MLFHYMKRIVRPFESANSHLSLERGLRVIEVIADAGGSAMFSEIARKSALSRSTTHHLLRSLTDFGYLVQEGETLPYKLAPKIFRLTGRNWTQAQLAEVSIPFLDELSRRTGEGTSLAVVREGVVTVVAKRDSDGPVRVVQQVGATRPIYCTAVGKTLAAWLPEPELDAILRGIVFKRYTPRTMTTAAAFRQQLSRIRAAGFAIDNEEHIEGIRCLATPVRDQSGEVCAALCIVGPKNRLSRRRLTELRKPLSALASDLSVRLGYRGLSDTMLRESRRPNTTGQFNQNKNQKGGRRSGRIVKGI
jgi:DNA-binding IclR family transcriptional regulator